MIKGKTIKNWSMYIYIALCPFCYYMIGRRALYLYLFILTIGVYILGIIIDRYVEKPDTTLKYLLVLWIIYFISVFYSVSSSNSLSNLLEISIIYIPLVLFSINRISTKNKQIIEVIYFFASLIFLIVLVVQSGQHIYWNDRSTINFGTIDINSNFMEYVLIIPFAYCLKEAFSSKKKKIFYRSLMFVIMIFDLYGTMLTGSRGAIVAVVGVVIVQMFFIFKENGTKLSFYIVLVAIILASYFMFDDLMSLLPDSVNNRLQLSTFTDSNNRNIIWFSTLKWRLHSANTFQMFFGTGYGTSSTIIGSTTHNMFLEVLLENGYVGLVIFTGFIISMFRRIKVSHNWYALSIWIGVILVSLLVAGQTSRFFWFTFLYVYIITKIPIDCTNKDIVLTQNKIDSFIS